MICDRFVCLNICPLNEAAMQQRQGVVDPHWTVWKTNCPEPHGLGRNTVKQYAEQPQAGQRTVKPVIERSAPRM